MKAAVLHTFGEPLQIEDVSVPEPALRRGSDPGRGLRCLPFGLADHSSSEQPGFKSATKARLIPGHEVVGRVAKRGSWR